jgi:glucosamine-6-phosphate deaminase
MGALAANDIADEIRTCLQQQAGLRMIFAAAPSQSEVLSALREEKDIDWARITAFHMDEYLNLPAGAPQRFSCWLRKAIFDHLPFAAVQLLEPGDNPEQTLLSSTLRRLILSVAASAPMATWRLTIHLPTSTTH